MPTKVQKCACCGSLGFDVGLALVDNSIVYGKHSVRVAPTVRELMRMLLEAHPRKLSSESIYTRLYAHRPDCDQPDEHIVYVFVSHLRRALRTLSAHAGGLPVKLVGGNKGTGGHQGSYGFELVEERELA